jgi:heptosyltransferase-2
MMKLRRENIERIVVRGTNWVGDTVISVAALRRLRQLFPEAQITLVIRSSAAALFLESNFIDKVLPYDRRGLISVFKQIAEFRQQRFDLAVLFQNAFEAALIPFLARVPIRVGYATDGRRHLLTHSFPLPEWREQKHEVFYYLNIVDQLERLVNATSTHSEDKVDYSLTVSGPRQSQIHQRLDTCLSRKGPTVVLCPGSINSRAKLWPAEVYAKIADRLIE